MKCKILNYSPILWKTFYLYNNYVELYDNNHAGISKIIDWNVYSNTGLFYVTSV